MPDEWDALLPGESVYIGGGNNLVDSINEVDGTLNRHEEHIAILRDRCSGLSQRIDTLWTTVLVLIGLCVFLACCIAVLVLT